MAPGPFRRKPLGLDVPRPATVVESPPGIAALFVIRFDIKAGYFVHEQYAGISAFVNWPAEEAERNAKMFAIGVLVPLSSGILGKSWRHAPKLKELAA
ncbi:hypothetical protein RIB2604_01702750 [Aspergillus luchuensis]|uniref:Uncharacterized protein n=1 Tax=Aspergillus kawachii TaxID=1069201 RepID=A0A146FBW2_ASPKA|nr:hypothetical protein RIB2604_01702750 [Aspergillus luchuensis]